MASISPLELVLILIVCALILIVDNRYGDRGLIGAFSSGFFRGFKNREDRLRVRNKDTPHQPSNKAPK